jgi:hypothetical protein
MKRFLFIPIFLLSIICFSCSKTLNEPDEQLSKSNISNNINLSKQVTYTSSQLSWPHHEVQGIGRTYWTSNSEFTFSFSGYNFNLIWEGCSLLAPYNTYTQGVVSVYVNGQYIRQVSWSDPRYSPTAGWLGWWNFSYNDIPMKIKIYKGITPWDGSELIVATWTEPDNAQVQVIPWIAPDPPTGFSRTPGLVRDLNQAITISWNISTDTDVTGYRIYRYLQTQQYWTLIQTINSRTTSSWVDSNVPWSTANPEMTVAEYKMTAFDGTHNLTSACTQVLASTMP